MRITWFFTGLAFIIVCMSAEAAAQTPLTWAQLRTRFEMNNPTLHAGQLTIDESRADELTAFLRPNPQMTIGADVINLFESPEGSGRFDNMLNFASFQYTRERGGKRELRRASAQGATAIAVSSQADLLRTLTFTLRGAFVQVLQAKAFLSVAQAELTDYDQLLGVSRDRFRSGDIAQIDLDRLELQRVQYESDVQTATVNLRTAKIQLLQLLNDQTTAVEAFDVTGAFDFVVFGQKLEDLRQAALQARPDLRAAEQAIDKARTDFRLAVANGSTDPTLGVDVAWPQQPADYQPPVNWYIGGSVSIPLRIFDRNQGEKQKTKIDITRTGHLAEATRAQVLADVGSAYATVMSTVTLLQPYRNNYLPQAVRVRDTMSFSYQRGGAALIDFLQAQQEYRTVQLAYVNLVAAFLNAAAQLNLATGQEVIP
jgi:cobalt-zinc-cadmium efflux system outer membrane protein